MWNKFVEIIFKTKFKSLLTEAITAGVNSNWKGKKLKKKQTIVLPAVSIEKNNMVWVLENMFHNKSIN